MGSGSPLVWGAFVLVAEQLGSLPEAPATQRSGSRSCCLNAAPAAWGCFRERGQACGGGESTFVGPALRAPVQKLNKRVCGLPPEKLAVLSSGQTE